MWIVIQTVLTPTMRTIRAGCISFYQLKLMRPK